MKSPRLALIGAFLPPCLAWAVYAPIPEQEQGKAFTVTITSGAMHDSNLFGAATGGISSMVYSVSPKLAFNASVSKQTFLSASYEVTADYFDNRPTDKALFSHGADLRLAHAFSRVTNIDLNDAFQIDKNPQSLLAGKPLNTDQSYSRNQFDGTLTTTLDAKTGMVLKYRNLYTHYDNVNLSRDLNHMEHLTGLQVENKVLPELSLGGEYRFQAIVYDHAGTSKDKTSHFFLGGADCALAKKFTLSARAGAEQRHRDGDRGTTAPFAEFVCQYTYGERSYVSGGYTYSLAEADDPVNYTDSKQNQIFVNVQHAVAARVVISASATAGPAALQGRGTVANLNETTLRLGGAITYVARKNFSVSGTVDYDKVDSDLSYREQARTRCGISGRLTF